MRLTDPIVVMACAAAMTGVSVAAWGQTPGYHLPGNPSDYAGSYAAALSADGRVLAGYALGGLGSPGFAWSETSGRYDFGLNETVPARVSRSAAISGDGRTVAGKRGNIEAFVWYGPGTFRNLGFLEPFHDRSDARGVSGNGSVVVGSSYRNMSLFGTAYRWTQDGGMEGLGHIPGHIYSEANAISRDGTVIVGMSQSSSGQSDAFRWTEAGGMQALPLAPGTTSAWAQGTNHDGSIISGFSGDFGVLWQSGSVQVLPNPPLWFCNGVTDINDGASVAIGLLRDAAQNAVYHIWTPTGGWQTTAAYFAAQGFPLPAGWVVNTLNTLSADGRTFAGTYVSDNTSQSFVLTVPSPGTLAVVVAGSWCFSVRRRRPPTAEPH